MKALTSTGHSVVVKWRRTRRTAAERLEHLGIVPRPLRRVPEHPLPRETGKLDKLDDATAIKVLAVHMAAAAPRSALK